MQSNTKLKILELGIIITLFLGIIGLTYFKSDSIFKLLQLSIAAFSSGMLIYSWMRWRNFLNLNKEQRINKKGFLHISPICSGITWLFWLTLTFVAWGAFGQDFLWDMTKIVKSGSSENGTPDIKAYLAGMAMIIAIITGFYLSTLNTATKYAKDSAKEAREMIDSIKKYRDEIGILEKEQGKQRNIDTFVLEHLRFINQNLLTPTFLDLQFLFGKDKIKKQERLEQRIRLINANILLFNIIKSKSCKDFLQYWDDVEKYKDVYNNYDYSHLFQIAKEYLDNICKECTSEQRDKVIEIKQFIEDYQRERPYNK